MSLTLIGTSPSISDERSLTMPRQKTYVLTGRSSRVPRVASKRYLLLITEALAVFQCCFQMKLITSGPLEENHNNQDYKEYNAHWQEELRVCFLLSRSYREFYQSIWFWLHWNVQVCFFNLWECSLPLQTNTNAWNHFS